MISIIIPIFNEEKSLPMLLDDLRFMSDTVEIIVVDGGSTDNSVQVAKFRNVRVLECKLGRARQMNKGAEYAKKDHLMFIHADSRLPKNSLKTLIRQIEKLETASFYVEFDASGFMYRWYSRLSKINHSLFTYGDQGLVIKKSIFDALGGFKNIPIMEDIDFIRRLKKSYKFEKLNAPIITSARRFKENGVIFQQIKNIVMVVLFILGVSPHRLIKYYPYK